MLDFRKLFLTVVALALFASLSMTTAAPTASTLNLPAAKFIGVNDNLIIGQCAFDTASTASRPTKVAENVQAVDVGDVALTAGTTANVAQGLNTMDQCAMPDGVAVGGFRATEVTKSEYSRARVSQAAQLTAHFDGDVAIAQLGASTRSPSPPNAVLNHNTAKMVEVDVANPASNRRR